MMLTTLLLVSALTPPIPSVEAGHPAVANIIEYRPGSIRCGDETLTPVFTTEPLPTSTMLQRDQDAPSYTVSFRVAKDGRPIAISDPVRVEGTAGYFAHDDLAPALAAWRFAAGAERERCTVTFAPHSFPVATAPIATIYRFVALPRPSWPGWEEAKARTMGDGCTEPRLPARTLIGLPDFDRIPQPPASMSWTMVGFDIDAKGKPVGIRKLGSDDNRALDRASIDAVARSRFAAGAPRTGCSLPFYRSQNQPLAAPDMPPDTGPTNDLCRAHAQSTEPLPNFPPAFRRRAIDGWAIVQFDIAPWGERGNIKVLRAEPAAQFGTAARQIVAMAKSAPSATGASGCVLRIRYKMAAVGAERSASSPSVTMD